MPATLRPRRSALYVPGSNRRGLDRARAIPADVLILDLEDAVAPEEKEEARLSVGAVVEERAYGRREVVIRVNGLDTPWIARDIAAAVAAQPDAILVPKISKVEDVRRALAALAAADAPAEMSLWVMVETPLAVLNVAQIAAVNPSDRVALAALVIGTNDLARQAGLRIRPGRTAQTPWLAQCVLAARAYGLAILDGTYNDLNDWKGFRAECEQARDLGMDGKTAIHPNQVQIANEAFAPSVREIEWAERVLAAFARPENRDKAVIAVDGEMVERMHILIARRIIETASAIWSPMRA